MEYIGYIFGIFGLMAYLQLSSLKSRVAELERALTSMKGSTFHERQRALSEAVAKSYIGNKVKIELKEDHEDVDIFNYGNTKHGSIEVLDADQQWLLVQIQSPKGSKKKLLRLESIESIALIK